MYYDKFHSLCESNNVTIYRVAKDSGVDASTLYHWKAGSYTPKAEKLIKVANYFGVPISYFYN